jgi:hypothetical protein
MSGYNLASMRVLASKLLDPFFVELALEPFGRLKVIVGVVKSTASLNSMSTSAQ